MEKEGFESCEFQIHVQEGNDTFVPINLSNCILMPEPIPTPSDQPMDIEPPVITILGANPVTIEVDTPYTDAGATAVDNADGTIQVITTSNVDSNKMGSYSVTYSATDSSGNIATATRTVIVSGAISSFVTGFITDENGDPLSEVLITTDGGGGAVSLPNGSYVLYLYPGNFLMKVKKEGFEPCEFPIHVSEGIDTHVSINLSDCSLLPEPTPIPSDQPTDPELTPSTDNNGESDSSGGGGGGGGCFINEISVE